MSAPLDSGSPPPTSIFMIDFIMLMLLMLISCYFTMVAVVMALLLPDLGVLAAIYLLFILLLFYSQIKTCESAII